MKKAKILILTQILLLTSLFVAPTLTNRVHGTPTGLVCIAHDGATSCPNIPAVLTPALNNSTQLRVAVFIQNSDVLNAFDITLKTNHTVLKPAAADLAGTILPASQIILLECIGGVRVRGSTCSSTDTIDTLRFAVATSAGYTAQPSTGLLFTAIYNITGTSSNTALAFQTGCASTTSVSGGVCVTIANGGVTAVPETVQTASFSGAPGIPSFVANANPSALSIVQGQSGTSQIIVTSLGNFTGPVSLTPTVIPSGPVATLGISTLLVPPNGQNFTTLTIKTVATVAKENYNVTVTAKSGALLTSTTVSVAVTGVPPTADFLFSGNPASLSIGQGTSRNSTMIATSIGGFSGTIVISLTAVTGPVSLRWTNTITLLSGGTGNALIVATASPFATPGSYNVTMKATSGLLSHSATINVHITPLAAFSVDPVSFYTILVPQGFSNSTIIEVRTNSLFNGIISLKPISSPLGLSLVLNRTTFAIGPNSAVNSTLTLSAASSTPPGFYFVNVVGSSGNMTQVAYMNVQVVAVTPPPTPDFTITTNPFLQTIQAGFNTTYTISFTSLNGFSNSVNLTASVSPSFSNAPSLHLIPPSIILPSGGSATAILLVSTSGLTPAQFYTITVTGIGGGKIHFVIMSLQVLAPPDEQPVANFTFAPSNPVVRQNINFDGSSSVDPDGAVVSWQWYFGDNFYSYGEFTSHSYSSPGNYTVTLTVQDIAGMSSFKSTTIMVRPPPPHDVAIIQAFAQPNKVVATQSVTLQVGLTNTGTSNETVSVTVYANGQAVKTLKGIFLQPCTSPFCFSVFYLQILWDTNGVSPGNYTLSVTVLLPAGETDPTPADNTATAGTVTVLPAPVIVITPNTGVDGTKVLVQGSGFPVQQQFGYLSSTFVYVNFDNMSVGFTFSHNGTFAFTFDVPLSQPGAHGVFAYDPFSGAHASAIFTVQPTPTGTLAVSINVGTIYFPGDTAVAYVLTTFNGAPVGPQNVRLQLILFRPDGTNITLTATPIGNGLYKATYAVPSTGTVLGTYLVLAKAHQPGPIDSTTLASFEVQPTWLSSNGSKITVGATTLAGVIGIGAVAWKKGYLRRKNGEDSPSTTNF